MKAGHPRPKRIAGVPSGVCRCGYGEYAPPHSEQAGVFPGLFCFDVEQIQEGSIAN